MRSRVSGRGAVIDVSSAWDEAWREEQTWQELNFGVGGHDGKGAAFEAAFASYVAELVSLANRGHVDAAKALLWFVAMGVEDPVLLHSTQLKEWFEQFVYAVEDHDNRTARALLAPRPRGGRTLDHADSLHLTIHLVRIKRTACRVVRYLIDTGIPPKAAFADVEELMKKTGVVNPRTGTPYASGTVRGWYYVHKNRLPTLRR